MHLSPYEIHLLFFAIFALSIIGFLIAINSRGPVRAAFSYVLATALLVGSLFELVNYINEQKIRTLQVRQTPVVAPEPAPPPPAPKKEENNKDQEYAQAIRSTASRAKEITRSLSGLDLQDESVEIETYFAKAAAARNRASELSREFARRPAPEQGFGGARDALTKGLAQTMAAAKYLDLYFKSEDEFEEEKREQAFRASVRQANSFLDQADALVTGNR